MKLSATSQLAAVALPLVVSAVLFLAPLSGQEKKPAADKPKGRLPAYYGQINVDEKQRTKIYEVQAKYKEEIDKLEAELKKVNDKLKADVEAVLTKDQKEKLDKLIADAKTKGKKGSVEPSKEEEKKPEKKPE